MSQYDFWDLWVLWYHRFVQPWAADSREPLPCKNKSMQTFFSCTALEINVGLGLTSMCGGKKGEEFADLELRVVFVHWAHREKRRGTAVCERVNVLWKKPRGFWTLIGISIIMQPAFLFLCSSSSLSFSTQSVSMSLLGVSDQCWHSQCTLLQCCLYWEISIPLIVEVWSLHWSMGQHFNPEATLLCQNTLKGGIHSASVYT